VVRVLRTAILRGLLEEEETLRQADIASKLGVSHIPVREAFCQLAAEGLLSMHPNKGAVVIGLSPEDVAEIYNIRSILEVEALRLAVPKLTPSVLSRCEFILENAYRTQNVHEWGDLNWEFHETLYIPGESPCLLGIIKNLYANVDRYARLFFLKDTYRSSSLDEHSNILASLKIGDFQRALKALKEHLTKTSLFLVNQLHRRNSEAKN